MCQQYSDTGRPKVISSRTSGPVLSDYWAKGVVCHAAVSAQKMIPGIFPVLIFHPKS